MQHRVFVCVIMMMGIIFRLFFNRSLGNETVGCRAFCFRKKDVCYVLNSVIIGVIMFFT